MATIRTLFTYGLLQLVRVLLSRPIPNVHTCLITVTAALVLCCHLCLGTKDSSCLQSQTK